MFISRKKHEAMVALKDQEIRALDQLSGKFMAERDAETRRAGNLESYFRMAANQTHGACADRDRLAAELAHWKQHGQLRDPKTGRLIPKAKTEAG